MHRNGVFSSTLCWDCANAVPDGVRGCSWSLRFKPVKGWEAETDKVHESATYTVLSCPMFERDSFGCGISRVEK